ncbi:MAG: hypothetical protein QGH59_03225, partial [Gemmatimonadota bacterium]|nr:hypothetical protein [Gemmatimonadota bacterium]
MPRAEETRRGRFVLIALAVTFAVSRALAWQRGVRFDASPLGTFHQYLDPALLRDRPLESLWHLHAQPPLMNAFLAGVMQFEESLRAPIFHAAYLACGLLLCLSVFRLSIRLGAGRWISPLAALLFSLGPAALLRENHLFYAYPVATLLVLAALALFRFLESDRNRDGVLFFAILAAIALMRSLFHPGWMVAVILVLARHPRVGFGRALRLSLIPLLLVGGWYAKTAAMTGQFAGSTWMGMSLAKITVMQGEPEARKNMVRKGELSGFALVPPFRPLPAVRKLLTPLPPTGVPVLDEEFKSTGKANFHHAAYPGVSRAYLADALTVIRRHPLWYARGLRTAWRNSFRASWSGEFLADNRARIPRLDALLQLPHAGKGLLFAGVWFGVLAVTFRRLLRS